MKYSKNQLTTPRYGADKNLKQYIIERIGRKRMKTSVKRISTAALAAALCVSIVPQKPAYAAFAGENTPAENVFSIGGKNFILLDSEGEGAERKYLILSKDFCGDKYYNLEDSTGGGASWNKWEQVFYVDESQPNSIGYWLNSTYLNSELPESGSSKMADYIPTMDWATEGGCSTLCPEDYTVTAKIVVPSVTELTKYESKIGYKDACTSGFWWTRSAWKPSWTATNDDKHAIRVVLNTGAFNRRGGAKGNVRPIFWLNNDFFDDMAIDLMNAGDNIVEMIKTNYTDEQLSDIYSADVISWLRGGEVQKPVASNVKINGLLETTETITAEYDLDALGDESKTSVKWEISTETGRGTGEYGEWTNVGTGASLVLKNNMVTTLNTTEYTTDGNKAYDGTTLKKVKIRAKVTPVSADGVSGDAAYSEEYMTEPALGPLDRAFPVDPKLDTAPDTNVFEVDGTKFILLDTYTKNGERSYFVISRNAHGKRAIDSVANWNVGGDNIFSVDDRKPDKAMSEKHMAYWLNSSEEGGFLNDATENTLPVGIKEYIDKNHVWKTESTLNGSNVQTGDYAFTAGITLLSAREFQKYSDKIGYGDTGSEWWLRTGYARERGKNMVVKASKDVERTIGSYANDVRPVFYLKDGFFKNVKVNVYNIGDSVKALMKANYSEEELKAAGYSSAELNVLYDRTQIEKPVISAVGIDGTGETLTDLTANVTYGEFADESKTQYQWQLSTDGTSFSDIAASTASGATAAAITVNNSIASYPKRFLNTYPEYNITRYVRVKATPISSEGIVGDAVYSEAFKMPAAAGPISYRSSDAGTRMPDYSSEDDIFTVGDRKFILLDTNENGEFLALAAESYGTTAYDSDKTQKYDPTDKNNIGYYVSNTVFPAMPSAVRENALLKKWKTEAGNINGNAPTDYYVEEKAVLISLSEIEKYAEKIGMKDSGGVWGTRTPEGHWFKSNDVAKEAVITMNVNATPAIGGWGADYGSFGTRPLVWLDRSFFTDAKIGVSDLGANVREAMKEIYTVEELQSMYTNAELNIYFGIGEFVIKDAQITATSGNDSTVNVTVKSYQPEAQEVLMIASVYDAEGKVLKGMSSVSFEAAAGVDTAQDIIVTNTNPADGDIIKIMLWSDWEQIVPLCSPVLAN